MKRRKKPEPGPAVRVDVIVVEEPTNPDQLLERFRTLAVADARRAAPFRDENVKRRRKKEHDYQEFQAIAKTLRASDPVLRRAKDNRLADTIREKFRNRGRTVSIKTIVRALQQTKK